VVTGTLRKPGVPSPVQEEEEEDEYASLSRTSSQSGAPPPPPSLTGLCCVGCHAQLAPHIFPTPRLLACILMSCFAAAPVPLWGLTEGEDEEPSLEKAEQNRLRGVRPAGRGGLPQRGGEARPHAGTPRRRSEGRGGVSDRPRRRHHLDL
jgi:hypothetical protein